VYAIAQDDPPVTVTDAMAPGDRWLTQSVDNPAMRRFRAGRAGVAAVAVVAVAGIAIALTAAQAQGRNDEQATFQVRAEIASRFVATYVAELLLNEQVTATVQLGGIPPSSTAFQAVNDAFGFEAVVLLDRNGDVLAVDPPSPKLLGTNISHRYPHLASAVAGHPAVSNLTLSAALGIPVVAFATPFPAINGVRRVYSGAYEVAATPLTDYLANAIPYPGHQAYLIDALGNIVTSSPILSDSTIHSLKTVDPGLGSAIAVESHGLVSEQNPTYFAMQPVPGTPWRVVVTVPTASLFSAISGATLWLPWVLYALFSVGLATGLLFFFRYLDGRDDVDRLNLDLDRLSRIDSLTGLFNRRHLDEQLTRLLSTARRRQEPLSVLLIDVDHFKRVNDTAGHSGGDRALQETARRLSEAVRAGDVVGRWGGEEFLVLLPNTDPTPARILAERLRVAVSATPVDVGDKSVTITISIGVACGISTADADLVKAADDAMYESKRLGRNRVTAALEPVPVGS
jgi:diguanylate cyclase (GGDEF)-like protein